MPATPGQHERDWTLGPAKWFAVGVLSTLATLALAWSVWTGRGTPFQPAPLASAAAVQPPASAGRVLETSPSGPQSPSELAARTSQPPPPPSAKPERDQSSAARESPAPKAPLTRTININSAPQAELELLPGIGPALAQRIIDERARLGGFKTIDDLDRVRGIGPKLLARLRPHISIEVAASADTTRAQPKRD